MTLARVNNSNDRNDHIINHWLSSSLLISNSQPILGGPQLEDILLEGDAFVETLLPNPQANLAQQLETYYETKLDQALEPPFSNDTVTLYLEERSIWKLANALYSERAQRVPQPEPEGPPLFPATDFQLVQHLLTTSERLSDASIVRNWLESTAPPFQPILPRKGGWTQTQEELKSQSRQVNSKRNLNHQSLVTELDPDAITRQDRSLALKDEKFETELLRTLYFYLRRGDIEEAITLALSSDQPWRSASIRGGLYYKDPKLDFQLDEGMSLDFDHEDDNTIMGDEFSEVPIGNVNRFLWKTTCYMISKEPKNPKYERALYAILCGDLDTLLEVCETWEDSLWAYYNCFMESRIEKYFRQCGRTNEPVNLPSPPLLDITEKDIFDYLEQSPIPQIHRQASNDYSQIKKHLILGSLDQLIEDIHSKLLPTSSGVEHKVDFRVVRTLSLLILYLRSIGFLRSLPSADKIIQVYIARLVDLKQYRFAILYCSKLHENLQADIYASLLSRINDTLEIRLKGLSYGSMYGLNFDRILLVVTEKALEEAMRQDIIPDNLDPQTFTFHTWCDTVPDSVRLQIRAFEWINHESSFYADAIGLCNSACRRFLKTGRVWAAKLLLEAMPDDLILPQWRNDIEESNVSVTLFTAVREHLNYHLLVDAFQKLDHWNSVVFNKPSEASSEYSNWLIQIKDTTTQTETALRDVLTCDWMSNCFPGKMTPDSLVSPFYQDFLNLRRLYLPELVFQLYDVLYSTVPFSPKNLLKAFDFGELVASEKFLLYRELMARPLANNQSYNALPQFLERMWQVAATLLQQYPNQTTWCFPTTPPLQDQPPNSHSSSKDHPF